MSFAEQLAARAAKVTSASSSGSIPPSSPTRREGSVSSVVTPRSSKNHGQLGSGGGSTRSIASHGSSTVHNSDNLNTTNTNTLPSLAKSIRQRAEESSSSGSHTNKPIKKSSPAALPQAGEPSSGHHATATTSSSTSANYKERSDKYKSENKKLRKELLILKEESAQMDRLKSENMQYKILIDADKLLNDTGTTTAAGNSSSNNNNNNNNNNNDNNKQQLQLQNQIKHLQTLLSQQQESHKIEMQEKLSKQEKDLKDLHQAQLEDEVHGHKVEVEQLHRQLEQQTLEQQHQLQKMQEQQQQNQSHDNLDSSITSRTTQNTSTSNNTEQRLNTKFNAIIEQKLQEKITHMEHEVTELKNAEIDLLRKQLARAESRATKEQERAEHAMIAKKRGEDELEKMKKRMERMFTKEWNYSYRGGGGTNGSTGGGGGSIASGNSLGEGSQGSGPMNNYSLANDAVLGSVGTSTATSNGNAGEEDIDKLNESLSEMILQKSNVETELAQLKLTSKKEYMKMKHAMEDLEDDKERLRDEVRRLNLEVSEWRNNRGTNHNHNAGLDNGHCDGCDETEDGLDFSTRYHEQPATSSELFDDDSNTFNNKYNSNNRVPKSSSHQELGLDTSDTESLLSIISMLRATVDQTTREKDLLEQRLTEEQERSQMELRSFAATLEGVDELRKSAEVMSREIRRIKIKGYRPTRSDLLGGGGGLGSSMNRGAGFGINNFDELTAAVQASESMEDAIQLIESQNEAVEERRRFTISGGLGGRSNFLSRGAANTDMSNKKAGFKSLNPFAEENVFHNFWDKAGGDGGESSEGDDADSPSKDAKKKKKSKRKKKKGSDTGSVFTSFF